MKIGAANTAIGSAASSPGFRTLACVMKKRNATTLKNPILPMKRL
jgi:hypothetical protein